MAKHKAYVSPKLDKNMRFGETFGCIVCYPGTETELGGYEASDFLCAKASGVSYPQKVKLQFSHRMSRIVINLVKGSDFEWDLSDDIVVRVHNVVTDAVIDLGTGVVVKDSRAAGQLVE